MKDRADRSDGELALAAGHVDFELRALFEGAEFLFGVRPLADAHWTSTLEAMLLHLRNLWEFLFNGSPDKRHIAAVDFLPSWEAKAAFASSGLTRSTQGDLNKHLSHLSWGRIEEPIDTPEPDWRVPVSGVVTAFNEFVSQLPDGLRQYLIAVATLSVERIEELPSERWTASTTPAPAITILAAEQVDM